MLLLHGFVLLKIIASSNKNVVEKLGADVTLNYIKFKQKIDDILQKQIHKETEIQLLSRKYGEPTKTIFKSYPKYIKYLDHFHHCCLLF